MKELEDTKAALESAKSKFGQVYSVRGSPQFFSAVAVALQARGEAMKSV